MLKVMNVKALEVKSKNSFKHSFNSYYIMLLL